MQPANARSPIVVTPSGMLTEASDVQSQNASLPISVTPSGMLTSDMPFAMPSPSEQWTITSSGKRRKNILVNHSALVPP